MIPIIAAIGISVLGPLVSKAATTLIERTFGGSPATEKSAFASALEQSERTTPTRPPAKECQHLHHEIPAPTLTGGPMADASVSLLTKQLAEYRSLASMPSVLMNPLTMANSRKKTDHYSVIV